MYQFPFQWYKPVLTGFCFFKQSSKAFIALTKRFGTETYYSYFCRAGSGIYLLSTCTVFNYFSGTGF